MSLFKSGNRPRTKKKNNDSNMHMLGVRITMPERNALFEIAEYENRSVAGLIRHMINAKINNHKKRLK